MKIRVELDVTIPNSNRCNDCVYLNNEETNIYWCRLFAQHLRICHVAVEGIVMQHDILRCAKCRAAKVVER